MPVAYFDYDVSAVGDTMTATDTKRFVNPPSDFAPVGREPMIGVSGRMQFFTRTSGEHGRHKSGSWLGPYDAFRVCAPAKAPHIGRNAIHFPPNDGVVNAVPIDQADSIGVFRANAAS